jgi:hypothetical protein
MLSVDKNSSFRSVNDEQETSNDIDTRVQNKSSVEIGAILELGLSKIWTKKGNFSPSKLFSNNRHRAKLAKNFLEKKMSNHIYR